MKIVHIITRLILGGAQENTLITCREFAKRGHEVTLITGPPIGPEGQLLEAAKKLPIEIIIVDSMRREINPLHDMTAYFQIKKHLKRIQPDIVHTHSAKAGILGRLAGRSIKKKPDALPLIVHTIHGLSFHPYNASWKNRLYVACEKSTVQSTDAFISVADAMTDKAVAAGLGSPEMYTTAYSAIDEEPYLTSFSIQQLKDFRRRFGINEQSIVLTTVARLAELKGHEYIVESARRLAPEFENCTWLFIGDGNFTKDIRHDIQLAGLGYRFKFTGLLPPEQIPLALHASDILVHCSLREGLARVLPQAMLAEKPVVSFDIDGAKEVVNAETGYLIEPENVDELTDACRELIDSASLRQKLGQNARKSVLKKFAPETMADTIQGVYDKYLAAMNTNS